MKHQAPKVKVYGPNKVWGMSTERYQSLIEEAHNQGKQAWRHEGGSLCFASYDDMAGYVAITGDEGWTEIEEGV